MVNRDNYITDLWNLCECSNIDWDKTVCTLKGKDNYIELYLRPHLTNCLICNSHNLSLIKTRKREIKTTLRDDSFGIMIFHYRIYKCVECGKYNQENIKNYTINRGRNLSVDMDILNSIKDISLTYEKISEKYHVSKTHVLNIFDKYVDIKRKHLPEILSVDEIYSRRLTKTKYCFIMYNPVKDKIVDVLDSRRLNELKNYFYHIEKKERDSVKYYVSDLNESYRSVHYIFFKNSIHAVDSFHVIKNLSELFNNLRVKVMKDYESLKDDDNSSYWLFKKFYKLLLLKEDQIEDKEYNFRKFNMKLNKNQLISEMLKVDSKLKEAYYLFQEYKNFNEYYSYEEAPEKLEELIDNFINSSTEEMRKFGFLLINWRSEIINSFIKVNGWRLSNGKMENANRKIKLMFSNAYGYSNFPRTRNRILYSYNGSEPLLNKKKEFSNKRIQKSHKN